MEQSPAQTLELEDIVEKWAWMMWDMTKSGMSRELKSLPREALRLQVNWKRVKISHLEPQFADVLYAKMPRSQCLFKTSFCNETNAEQEYSMKTERTTRSTCDVETERSITRGGSVGVTLKTPCEVAEANCGFSREITLTDVFTHTYEQEMTWGVDSVIKVAPRSKTSAELVVSESQYSSSFCVTTIMQGMIHVSITNCRDNNSFVKSLEGNIVEIMRNEAENGLKGFLFQPGKCAYVTKGKCQFRFAIEQSVRLNQTSLDDEDMSK